MKLLLDQNISFRLIKKIEHLYLGTEQVRRLGLENKSDIDIWSFAKSNGFTIVTFDLDFFDLNTLFGTPPKIILLKTDNQTTDHIEYLLSSKFQFIRHISRTIATVELYNSLINYEQPNTRPAI